MTNKWMYYVALSASGVATAALLAVSAQVPQRLDEVSEFVSESVETMLTYKAEQWAEHREAVSSYVSAEAFGAFGEQQEAGNVLALLRLDEGGLIAKVKKVNVKEVRSYGGVRRWSANVIALVKRMGSDGAKDACVVVDLGVSEGANKNDFLLTKWAQSVAADDAPCRR